MNINTQLLNYQNAASILSQTKNQSSASQKNTLFQNQAQALDNNFNVNLSAEGLAALQSEETSTDIDTGIFTSKELSPKAQAYLEKLREKYGDYDFIVADNVDDPQALTANSSKNYSVILSSDELEKMAEDDDYANEVMGKVDDAVKTADSMIEQAAQNGVSISQLTISFDSEGNTKFFATLEKLSESQQERIDAARERAKEENTEEAEEIEPARISIEADDEESFLEQLWKIDWESLYNA